MSRQTIQCQSLTKKGKGPQCKNHVDPALKYCHLHIKDPYPISGAAPVAAPAPLGKQPVAAPRPVSPPKAAPVAAPRPVSPPKAAPKAAPVTAPRPVSPPKAAPVTAPRPVSPPKAAPVSVRPVSPPKAAPVSVRPVSPPKAPVAAPIRPVSPPKAAPAAPVVPPRPVSPTRTPYTVPYTEEEKGRCVHDKKTNQIMDDYTEDPVTDEKSLVIAPEDNMVFCYNIDTFQKTKPNHPNRPKKQLSPYVMSLVKSYEADKTGKVIAHAGSAQESIPLTDNTEIGDVIITMIRDLPIGLTAASEYDIRDGTGISLYDQELSRKFRDYIAGQPVPYQLFAGKALNKRRQGDIRNKLLDYAKQKKLNDFVNALQSGVVQREKRGLQIQPSRERNLPVRKTRSTSYENYTQVMNFKNLSNGISH